MAIIYSYPEKASPSGGDFLVITDSEQTAPNKNRTKSLTIDNLASYVISSTSGITGSGTLNTVPIFTGVNTIGDSIITYNSAGGVGVNDFMSIGLTNVGNNGGVGFVSTSQISGIDLSIKNISAFGTGNVSLIGGVIIGDQATDILQISSKVTDFTGTGSTAAGDVLVSNASGQLVWDTPSAGVTGTGTVNKLTKWSSGGTGIQNSNITDNGSLVTIASETNQTGKAVFRNGIVLSNNPGGITVDDTSMVIGAGNNDIISGADHCLAVGNNNQILTNSDNSISVGQGNTMTFGTACAVFGLSNTITGSNTVTERCLVAGFSNAISGGAKSAIVLGGSNTLNTNGGQGIILGSSNNISGTQSNDSGYILGNNVIITASSGTGLLQNAFGIGTNLNLEDGQMVLGYRNNPVGTAYPPVNYNQGLGETKFVLSVGTTTNTNSNALIITEGGVNRGTSSAAQVPRIVMPTVVGFNFADDTAAATGGIPVGGLYHNAGELRIRLT